MRRSSGTCQNGGRHYRKDQSQESHQQPGHGLPKLTTIVAKEKDQEEVVGEQDKETDKKDAMQTLRMMNHGFERCPAVGSATHKPKQTR